MCCVFFFQAEDGIRDLVRSRGLGDVYKRQHQGHAEKRIVFLFRNPDAYMVVPGSVPVVGKAGDCLLYTSDAADDLLCVDLGGSRIIKKKNTTINLQYQHTL